VWHLGVRHDRGHELVAADPRDLLGDVRLDRDVAAPRRDDGEEDLVGRRRDGQGLRPRRDDDRRDAEKTFTLELKDGESAAVCTTDDGYGYVIMPLARDR
jgi:hypothetical protein